MNTTALTVGDMMEALRFTPMGSMADVPRPTRVYVAGPMAGKEHHNFPAFHAAARRLRDMGHEVVNPAELNADPGDRTWEECMRIDIAVLMACDAMVLLPGWGESRGAKLEALVANELALRVVLFEKLVAGEDVL